MTRHTRFSVFLAPCETDAGALSDLIETIGAEFGLPPFEPHVTLHSGPFTSESVLREQIQAAIAGISRFSLRITGISCSSDYFKTLFLDLEENEPLRVMHNRLKDVAGNGSDGFHPHLSLLYRDMELREKEKLVGRVRLDRHAIQFDRVKLVVPGNRVLGWRDTGEWHTLFENALGAPPAESSRGSVDA